MTNAEKYVDEILNRVKWNKTARATCFYPFSYAVEHVSGISSNDLEKVLKWLFSEYDPPLLENGDNLKPGDWIMVKIGDVWEKRSFLCFDDGLFYTVNSKATLKNGFNFSRWEFARLPEEGE